MKNHIIILHTATKNSKRLNFGKKIFWNLFGEEEEEKGTISKRLEEKICSVFHIYLELCCVFICDQIFH